jgi:hypothetical protein
MFQLKNVKAARLWMLPPAVMEVAIELLWEDKLAHPQWPHVFVVPVEEGLGTKRGHTFHCVGGRPFLGGLTV